MFFLPLVYILTTFVPDLTRPEIGHGNIELVPTIQDQLLYGGKTADSSFQSVEEPPPHNASAELVSLEMSSGSYSVESSAQWASSFSDEDWDVDSSATH